MCQFHGMFYHKIASTPHLGFVRSMRHADIDILSLKASRFIENMIIVHTNSNTHPLLGGLDHCSNKECFIVTLVELIGTYMQ